MKNTNPDFQPVGYAGGLYDADTKLIRFGARDYDPTIGRWIERDPISFAGGDTNLFSYVGQDPVNKVDPSGNSAAGVIGTIICEAFNIYQYYQLKKALEDITETIKNQQEYIAKLKMKSDEPTCDPKILQAEKDLIKYLQEQARTKIELGSSYAIAIACIGLGKF